MKKIFALLFIAALIFGISIAPASATTIDFENVPEAYWFYGGNQNIGSYFPGVTFGPNATILENVVYGYNDGGYPPHSGHAVMFTSDEAGIIRADFSFATDFVSLYYTSLTDLYLEAYDSGNNLITSASGFDNYGGLDLLQVSGNDIAYVLIHDGGGFFTVDDFSFNVPVSVPVPEPSTLTVMPSLIKKGYNINNRVKWRLFRNCGSFFLERVLAGFEENRGRMS